MGGWAAVWWALGWGRTLLAAAGSGAEAGGESGVRFFEERIRPVLAEKCYGCHSERSEKLKGQFLADSREGIRRGGESRQAAVVPGNVERSRLIHAIRWGDEEFRMPPKEKLSAQTIADLEAWVRMGAPDPRESGTGGVGGSAGKAKRAMTLEEAKSYWAFQPLRNPALPEVRGAEWCETPVDRFVLARLEGAKLRGSAPAELRRLFRRLCLDLWGMPPGDSDWAMFEGERGPGVWERLVDRVLADPRYGERWGRYWLDVARFAESHGFEHDYDRPDAYHYRDFVIRALNADMPYSRFVQWQVAGDELAGGDPMALMATGFLGAGVFPTQITANEVERARYDALDDMAATTGAAFLGLTIGCARCHDHKFDPISVRDYYRLVSTFTTTVRSTQALDLDPEGNATRLKRWEGEHAAKRASMERFEREEMPRRFAEWLARGGELPMPEWRVLGGAEIRSEGGATFDAQSDGSFLARGNAAANDVYRVILRTRARGIRALRIEAMADGTLPKGGPGRASNGNFALSDVAVAARTLGATNEPARLAVGRVRATFEQKGLPVSAVADGDPKTAWAVDPQFGKSHAAILELGSVLDNPEGVELHLTLKFDVNTRHAIGRPRFSISTRLTPEVAAGTGDDERRLEEVATAWNRGATERTPKDLEVLRAWHRGVDEGWREVNGALEKSLAAKPKPILTPVMITSEGVEPMRHHTQGADFFTNTYHLKRGDVRQKGEVATQGFLPVLMKGGEDRWVETPPASARTSFRRKALARWLTDVDAGAGGLVARVMANRIWASHFGRGLVVTANDFGVQGQAPSHPELLEWLASELVRSEWSLKALHRQIVRSATYRQAGGDGERLGEVAVGMGREVDPDNRLLWHFPRRRLEAEAIRDSLLWVSGSLDLTRYGAGTLDESHRRRAIYFMMKRSRLISSLQLFDAPDGVLSAGVRPTTVTAPQALHFLNGEFVRQRARDLALQFWPVAQVSKERAIRLVYRRVLGRDPTSGELSAAKDYVSGEEGMVADAGGVWTDFCHVVLSLNEFVSME